MTIKLEKCEECKRLRLKTKWIIEPPRCPEHPRNKP